MLALRMQQKETAFYFVSFPADELLRHVRFEQRSHENEPRTRATKSKRRKQPDEITRFIEAVERSPNAFQRKPSRQKINKLRSFFEHTSEQPLIPGAILLYTSEQLAFRSHSKEVQRVGDLAIPKSGFLVIDGQHRLAGLRLYLDRLKQEHPSDQVPAIDVPCMIFDGRTEDFVVEMFVMINANHTRLKSSHLIGLYEKISYGADANKKGSSDLRVGRRMP